MSNWLGPWRNAQPKKKRIRQYRERTHLAEDRAAELEEENKWLREIIEAADAEIWTKPDGDKLIAHALLRGAIESVTKQEPAEPDYYQRWTKPKGS